MRWRRFSVGFLSVEFVRSPREEVESILSCRARFQGFEPNMDESEGGQDGLQVMHRL